ncbi:MAG: ribosome silencing factor [Clostridia bacterium]|nr:ribosome silencing factor [Clostridia bacterium]
MHNEMRELALKMARILDKKGALDIEILEVTHLTSITDYFLIASGRNIQAVRSLSEDLEDKLAEEQIFPRRRDGLHESRWIVLDFGGVIVHLFHPEERLYYNIERLWRDGENLVPFVSIDDENK